MKEDIIKLAREAGCIPRRHPAYDNDVQVFATPDVLERFYQLAVKAEREACAQLLDDMAARDKLSNYYAIADKAIRERGQA